MNANHMRQVNIQHGKLYSPYTDAEIMDKYQEEAEEMLAEIEVLKHELNRLQMLNESHTASQSFNMPYEG